MFCSHLQNTSKLKDVIAMFNLLQIVAIMTYDYFRAREKIDFTHKFKFDVR